MTAFFYLLICYLANETLVDTIYQHERTKIQRLALLDFAGVAFHKHLLSVKFSRLLKYSPTSNPCSCRVACGSSVDTPSTEMGAYQKGQRKSIIDNLSVCVFVLVFVLPAHRSSCRFWKARHPAALSLSLNLLCGLQQDLKDLMRKAGEVTFVDAHRPNRNEG